MQVLAGDIGGTKTLLAICEVPLSGRPGAPPIEVLASSRYDSRNFPGVGTICRAFAAEVGRPLPRRAAFGVAGPVKQGRSHTTNLPWIVDEGELARALGLEAVRLVNDFQALAMGLPAVGAKDLLTLNQGVRDPRGPTAVIGAGTGLGEAIAIVSASGEREVLPTEGGHCSFAPRTELQCDVLRFLMKRYDHVSWERVLSGDGLVNLTEALADIAGQSLAGPLATAIARDRPNAPAEVTAAAQAGDPLCRKAVELFCELYGAEAGNLALKALATGGVYVAGGIAPKLAGFLTDGRFRSAFADKGRMRGLLEQMPVQLVLDTEAGVLGAAALAAHESQGLHNRQNPTKSAE